MMFKFLKKIIMGIIFGVIGSVIGAIFGEGGIVIGFLIGVYFGFTYKRKSKYSSSSTCFLFHSWGSEDRSGAYHTGSVIRQCTKCRKKQSKRCKKWSRKNSVTSGKRCLSWSSWKDY